MLSRKRYILMMALVLFSALRVVGQFADGLPDNVCVGKTKKYWVTDSLNNPNYTYKWEIKDIGNNIIATQESTICMFTYQWNIPGDYEVTLQEFSASPESCPGNVSVGMV